MVESAWGHAKFAACVVEEVAWYVELLSRPKLSRLAPVGPHHVSSAALAALNIHQETQVLAYGFVFVLEN